MNGSSFTTGRMTRLGAAGLALAVGLAGPAASAGPAAKPMAGPAAKPAGPMTELGPGFRSANTRANGVSLHHVRGGSGPAVVLLHGYPQDWYEWHGVMPRLARRFTVVAVDLRGVGGSEATAGGYDAATLAEDVHQLASALKLGRYYVVGHDIGGMVAYALARLHPDALRGAMILDVPLPGVAPWSTVEANPLLWHFHFHQTARVPELLVAGREAAYFRHAFFNRFARRGAAIGEEAVARYARSYGSPDRLRAGFEFYRAFPANVRFNESRKERLDLPIVLAGGDGAVGPLNAAIAESLKGLGCRAVTTEIVRDSGHYVAEEQPEAVAALIERHASAAAKGRANTPVD